MKKQISLILVLVLLGLFTGCSGQEAQGSQTTALDWFKNQLGIETEAPSSDAPADGQEDQEQDKPIAPVTEVINEIDSFGLAYQVEYGLHPYNCLSLCNRAILSFLYEPLFAVSSTFVAEPVLAKSWYVSDDGLKTTVTLHSGIAFSSGKPLTSADVAYSIESARSSAYYGNRFSCITAVETPDDVTIVFTTRTAYGDLPLLLDIPIISDGTAELPVPPGTGPYRYAGPTKLEKNRNWWQGEEGQTLVDFDEIGLVQADSSADIRDQFEYENINLVWSDPTSAAHANFHSDYELWNGSTTVMQYIGYNIGSKVYSNYGLRGAVTYAIDREKIVAEQAGGFALPAVLPTSPLSSMYDVKLANDYSYSEPKYYERLESASVEDMDADGVLDLYVSSLGYAIPVDGTMIVCGSSYQRVQAATAVVSALNELGFDLKLKTLDYAEYTEALLYGNFDLYYGEVRLSANFDLSPFFRPGGSLAYGYLADTTMENLCNRMLLNSGNSYDLYKRICDRGYITPILFKSYAVYTTRGSMQTPAEHLDWFLPKPIAEAQ